MNFIKIGSGRPVMLIHGLFGNLDNLKSVANELAKFREVICVDVRNHGLSPWKEDMEYANIANEIIDLIKSLNIEKIDLLGHSMGGKIAMSCALLHPEIIHSVIAADIAPVTYVPHHQDVLDALSKLNLHKIKSRSEALSEIVKEGINKPTAQFILKNLSFKNGVAKWLLNVKVLKREYGSITSWPFTDKIYQSPILFIKAENSDYLTSDHKEEVLAQFPNAEVKMIKDTTHWLHAERPAIFNRLACEFFHKKGLK